MRDISKFHKFNTVRDCQIKQREDECYNQVNFAHLDNFTSMSMSFASYFLLSTNDFLDDET